MTLAVIKTGGKQYLVRPGDEIKIEKLKDKKEGDEVVFEEILLVQKQNKIELGTPLVKKAKVRGKIVAEGKGKKITILKYKPKTRYKVKKGHRQPFIKVKITKIDF